MTSPPPAYILYVDHQGHVAPLGHCYHATASRRLSSSIERHPPSTRTEVDSAYCPQCLAIHDAATASTLGYCPKPTCKLCPRCRSVASLQVKEEKCFYVCGYCDYNSLVANLSVPCSDGAQVEAATEAIGKALEDRLSTDTQEAQFHTTLKSLERTFVEERKRLRQPNHVYGEKLPGPESGSWNLEALREALTVKKSQLTDKRSMGGLSTTVTDSSELPLSDNLGDLLLSPEGLPLSVPLRPRKSRRCCAELAEGRPGILIKPKLNPLEGDSSLRSQQGQWFKKDSSAILVVPKITVLQLNDSAVLLQIQNPTLGKVKIFLGSSDYAGEPQFEDPQLRTPVLTNILVDSLRNTVLESTTLDTSFRLEPPTDTIELQPAEDTYMTGSSGLPDQVKSWSVDTLGWIAQAGDKAWIGIKVPEAECVALSLNIHIGNGSWESSLIQANGDKDVVHLDVVLIRRQES